MFALGMIEKLLADDCPDQRTRGGVLIVLESESRRTDNHSSESVISLR